MDMAQVKSHIIRRALDDERFEMLCGRVGEGGQRVKGSTRPQCDACRAAARFETDLDRLWP